MSHNFEKITSLQNPKIKNLVKLQKASERKQQQLFIVEGGKEILMALEANYKAVAIYFVNNTGYANANALANIILISNLTSNVFEITSEIFSKIAYREKSDGIIMLAQTQTHTLQNIKLRTNPLIVILEAVEKPGNLGAVLRTADAANIDALIICDPRTDFYNPNVIRSSIGCLFTTQIASCTNSEVFEWLQKNNIAPYAAALSNNSVNYTSINYNNPSAIVMGTEANGLSSFWLNNCKQIIIPMLGKIDSLNVSNATAIIIYEALRQRGLK